MAYYINPPYYPTTTVYPTTTIYPTTTVYPVNPLYPTNVYPDVNSDKHLRKQTTEYFTNKIRNTWLKYNYLEIYDFVKVDGQTVTLISNMSELENNRKSVQTSPNLKHDYIVRNYLRRSDIYVLLEKFRKINDINWWDIKKHSDKFRKFVQYKLTKYIKANIGKN
jgi:hypothetical protein